MRNELWNEARRFAREQYDVARSSLGDRNMSGMRAATRFAETLYKDPTRSVADVRRAVEIFADVAQRAKRAFGPQHPIALEFTGIWRHLRDALSLLSPDLGPDLLPDLDA